MASGHVPGNNGVTLRPQARFGAQPAKGRLLARRGGWAVVQHRWVPPDTKVRKATTLLIIARYETPV